METKRISFDEPGYNLDVKICKDESVYQGFFHMRRTTLEHSSFSGGWVGPVIRETLVRDDAVAVLAYDPKRDAVCLVKQFRASLLGKAASPWSWELIAGLVDKEGEPIEESVKRELYEEAGVRALYLEPINSFWMSLGASSEQMHLWLALVDLEREVGVYGQPDESEDILAKSVTRAQAQEWAFDSMASNATAIIAMQWLEQERERILNLWAKIQP